MLLTRADEEGPEMRVNASPVSKVKMKKIKKIKNKTKVIDQLMRVARVKLN